MTVTSAPAAYYPHVGVVTLDHPESNNALTPDVQTDLLAGCQVFDSDPAIRCIVIAGTDGFFASGSETTEDLPGFWTGMAGLETPVLAAVSGYCLGAGWGLALLCDLIVAAENCDFGQPEITLGLIPGGGATQRLTRILGKHRTMELVLTGRRISGQEAFRLGLVNLATRKKEWYDQAIQLADRVGRRPPVAARLAKRAVLTADELVLADGLERDRELYDAAMATEDRVEGMAAFREGRQPRFQGR